MGNLVIFPDRSHICGVCKFTCCMVTEIEAKIASYVHCEFALIGFTLNAVIRGLVGLNPVMVVDCIFTVLINHLLAVLYRDAGLESRRELLRAVRKMTRALSISIILAK